MKYILNCLYLHSQPANNQPTVDELDGNGIFGKFERKNENGCKQVSGYLLAEIGHWAVRNTKDCGVIVIYQHLGRYKGNISILNMNSAAHFKKTFLPISGKWLNTI
jgi:hypothetical protein